MTPNEKVNQTKRLSELFFIRSKLLNSASKHEIIESSLGIIRDRIESQTAALFLMNLDGVLERVQINGYDNSGDRIGSDWYQQEQYAPGESFTGKVVKVTKDSPFGEPLVSKDLQSEELLEISRKRYKEKLGRLVTAITIPINGKNRSYGALEVINKYNVQSRDILDMHFDEIDLYELSILSMNLATALSLNRKDLEARILSEVSAELVSAFDSSKTPKKVYKTILEELLNDITPFKASILRVANSDKNLEIEAKAGKVNWNGRNNAPISSGDRIAGEVFGGGQSVFVRSIEEQAEKFQNIDWALANNFKSYACIPLRGANERIFGTLSLFCGYDHFFIEKDRDFLETIAASIAAYTEGIRVIQERDSINEKLMNRMQKRISRQAQTGYLRSLDDFIHRQKEISLQTSETLQAIESRETGRTQREITQLISKINTRIEEIKSILKMDPMQSIDKVPVDLNQCIGSEIRDKQQQSRRDIRFEFHPDPSLPLFSLVEEDISDVIYNLLTNSVKAIEENSKRGEIDGKIAVSTYLDNEPNIPVVVVQVSDNGIGIPNEILDNIFNRGFSTYPDGSGFGLSLAKDVIEDYGGAIEIVSSSFGKGTTIQVRIPIKRNLA